MNLFDTIKNWLINPGKAKLDHFDIDRIEKIINDIKTEPVLQFMQEQCEEFLKNIAVSSKDNKGSERKFIVINGVSGSGKTNFVYVYLKDFLLATGVTKHKQELIDKIASHELKVSGLRGRTVEDVIDEKVGNCEDGILILDEFTMHDKNAQVIADLITEMYESETFGYTSVILMGEAANNSDYIKKYNLDMIFPQKFRLDFHTPSFKQIGDIFELYAKREGKYTLNEEAKSRIAFYFNKLKLIKELKTDLHRRGTMNFPFKEKNYIYTSEMFPIYREIAALKNNGNEEIIEQDIIATNSYEKLLADMSKPEFSALLE